MRAPKHPQVVQDPHLALVLPQPTPPLILQAILANVMQTIILPKEREPQDQLVLHALLALKHRQVVQGPPLALVQPLQIALGIQTICAIAIMVITPQMAPAPQVQAGTSVRVVPVEAIVGLAIRSAIV